MVHRPPLEKLAHFAIEVCCLDFYLGTFCGAQAATHLHNGHTPAQWATDLATHLHNGHTCTFCGAQAASHSTHSVVHRPPHTCTMATPARSVVHRPPHILHILWCTGRHTPAQWAHRPALTCVQITMRGTKNTGSTRKEHTVKLVLLVLD